MARKQPTEWMWSIFTMQLKFSAKNSPIWIRLTPVTSTVVSNGFIKTVHNNGLLRQTNTLHYGDFNLLISVNVNMNSFRVSLYLTGLSNRWHHHRSLTSQKTTNQTFKLDCFMKTLCSLIFNILPATYFRKAGTEVCLQRWHLFYSIQFNSSLFV